MDDHEVHLPGGAKLAEENPALKSLDTMLQEADNYTFKLEKIRGRIS